MNGSFYTGIPINFPVQGLVINGITNPNKGMNCACCQTLNPKINPSQNIIHSTQPALECQKYYSRKPSKTQNTDLRSQNLVSTNPTASANWAIQWVNNAGGNTQDEKKNYPFLSSQLNKTIENESEKKLENECLYEARRGAQNEMVSLKVGDNRSEASPKFNRGSEKFGTTKPKMDASFV